MPKQPGGITKALRIKTVREVIEKWGELSKEQVDQHVANQLGLAPEDVSRAIYRDLEELVNDREIQVHNFTRDGQLIENFDSEVHKNFSSRWGPFRKNDFIGGSIAKNLGILILSSQRLANDISLGDARSGVRPGYAQIFFVWNNQFLCFSIDKKSAPFEIVIGRAKEEMKANFPDMEQVLGKRLIYIGIPDIMLSSFKDQSHLGHLAIKFEDNSQFTIRDLGPKNRSFYQKVSKEDVEVTIQTAFKMVSSTISKEWIDKSLKYPSIELKVGEQLSFGSPMLIKATDHLSLLVL